MNRLTIKCPKCGSIIEANYDNDIIFCNSCGCGYKFLREGQSSTSIPPKIRLTVIDMEGGVAQNEESRSLAPKEQSNAPISISGKTFLLICLIAFIVMTVIFVILNT